MPLVMELQKNKKETPNNKFHMLLSGARFIIHEVIGDDIQRISEHVRARGGGK